MIWSGTSPDGRRVRLAYGAAFVIAGAAMAAQLWGSRGPVLAVVAALAFGTIAAGVLVPSFRAWLRRRPYLDAFLTFPASLAIIAFITDFAMATCITIAAFIWLVLTITVTYRRQREQSERNAAGERGGRPRDRRSS
jgi:hypothetical protein